MTRNVRVTVRAKLGGAAALVLLAGVGIAATTPAGAQTQAVGNSPHPNATARVAPGKVSAGTEVWQRAQRPYRANRGNPLARRVWGVYQGPQDQVWSAYQSATPAQQARLDAIMLRPRAKWYGGFVSPEGIGSSVRSYIESSQAGDPNKLVQMAIFRMEPWEHEACERRTTAAEKLSYKRWILNLVAGIGATPTLIVMQPDGPFLLCAPDRKVKANLLTWATKKLSALPQTSVYIDAGAADWCQNDRGVKPETCAKILRLSGIKHARGFALDSTHYTGPADNIRHGAKIVQILRKQGYGTKRFIIDTAKSGTPTPWSQMVPEKGSKIRDNARVCRTRTQKRCVALGIPPTTQVADPRWGLSKADRASAKKYVDAFVWFGRPWLYNQADPFAMKRALTLERSTKWATPSR